MAEYRNRVGLEATGGKEGEDSPAEQEAGSSGHYCTVLAQEKIIN